MDQDDDYYEESVDGVREEMNHKFDQMARESARTRDDMMAMLATMMQRIEMSSPQPSVASKPPASKPPAPPTSSPMPEKQRSSLSAAAALAKNNYS